MPFSEAYFMILLRNSAVLCQTQKLPVPKKLDLMRIKASEEVVQRQEVNRKRKILE
jgi:hypothetical protein